MAAALKAVLFDVDFTLCRPGPELSPERYARIASRHGVTLDPARYEQAREAAVLNLKRHPELVHDDAIWHRFTEEIFTGMGGPKEIADECATEIEQGWEVSENFELYEDALAALEELRKAGLRIGLVSNGIRDLHEFVAHHRLDVDAVVDSRTHGRVKPHPTIFERALELLGVRPAETVMVGDSVEEDIEGAHALGMRAILIDRDERHPEIEDRLTDLLALPAALGLIRPGES
jgi:HAD superfamily hydrolase (TIGR01549 family)